MTIAELRENAITDYFETVESLGYELQSEEAQLLIHETAGNHIPTHYDTLLELAAAPYRNASANFFLLASVDAGTLESEPTAADVLNLAVYEFLRDEIGQARQDRIDHLAEEEDEDEE